jgi:ParB family chromosome partitioning protein
MKQEDQEVLLNLKNVLIVGAYKFLFSKQVQSSKKIFWWGTVEEDDKRSSRPCNLGRAFVKRGLARIPKIQAMASSNGAEFLEFGDESELFPHLTRILGIEADPKKEVAEPLKAMPSLIDADNREIVPPKDFVLGQDRVIDVLVERIRPFEDQPRKYFNPERLLALGRSLLQGQQIPIILIPVDGDPLHDYQLYDGERRWQAAKLVGKKTLRAIIGKPMSKPKLLKGSAICNFGREDHQAMEITRTLKQIKEDEKLTYQELADSFAHSVSWVTQYMSLANLNKQVQAMLDPELPEDQQITFSMAKELVKVPSDYQVVAAHHILDHKLNLPQVKHYIRKVVADFGTSGIQRQRKPFDDYKILQTFLSHASMRVDQFLDLPGGMTIETLFRRRPRTDIDESVKALNSLIQRLQKIKNSVIKADKK